MNPELESFRQLEFASHPGNLSLVRNFVRQFLEPLEFSGTDRDMIILGLDEACTNVIRHAYLHQPDQLICLACQLQPNGVVFRLRDFGVQGDPAKFSGRPLERIRPGGLGIHFIYKAFTQADYYLRQEGTELMLFKEFSAPTKPRELPPIK